MTQRGMGSLVVLLLAERAASERLRESGQVPFLLAERAIKTCSLDVRSEG